MNDLCLSSLIASAAQREYIDQGQVELRHPPVVLDTVIQSASTDGAAVFIVVEPGVSKTDAALQFPVSSYPPLVTVTDASPIEPSLAVMVLKAVAAERQMAQIEPSAVKMDAEIVPFRGVSKPTAHLGLYQPVLPFPFTEIPPVVVARDIERPAGGQPYLDTRVDSGGDVIEQVALDRDILGLGRHSKEKETHKQEHVAFGPYNSTNPACTLHSVCILQFHPYFTSSLHVYILSVTLMPSGRHIFFKRQR